MMIGSDQGAGARSAEHRRSAMRSSVVRWREATRSSSSLTRARGLEASPAAAWTTGTSIPSSATDRTGTEIDVRSDGWFTRERGVQEFESRVPTAARLTSISSLMGHHRSRTTERVELARRPSASMARTVRVTWAGRPCVSHTARRGECDDHLLVGRQGRALGVASGNRASRTVPEMVKVQLSVGRIRRTTGDTTTP